MVIFVHSCDHFAMCISQFVEFSFYFFASSVSIAFTTSVESGFDLGLEAGHDLAVAVEQKLLEVPRDLAGELRVGLLRREILVERRGVRRRSRRPWPACRTSTP